MIAATPHSSADLLPSEAAFIDAMQSLGFGRFEHVAIRGGEVVLDPRPLTIRDIKFGTPANTGRPAGNELELRPQLAEFFDYVRDVDAGEIRELEIRHGLPFSMEIELAGGRRG